MAKIIRVNTLLLLGAMGLLISCGTTDPVNELEQYLTDLPFAKPAIAVPSFPARSMNIRENGAVGDGHTLNTDAIQQTIQQVAGEGGGHVVIGAGIWLTGPLQLMNNIDLHLERGATLQFIHGFDHYPLIRGTWEGQGEVRCISPIFGKDLKNIAITGSGIIDGAGDAWRPVKKDKLTARAWKELVNSGGVVTPDGKMWWPSAAAMNGRDLVDQLNARGDATLEEYAVAREYLRPVMINLVQCRNILLDGPTFQNSPAWNIHPLLCTNLIVRNVNVRNPWYSQNGDGIDVESCKDVLLANCSFDVGDDGICIKSGKNKFGRDRGVPTENVIIRDCVVYHGHGGFTVGSEMSGGVRNILVDNCTFLGTDVGLRFKSTRGRGGIVENIFIRNIYMEDIVMEAIRFNLFYEMKEPIPQVESDGLALFKEVPELPVTEETPSFKSIKMEHIICQGAGQAILLYGLPEMAIQNVILSDLTISSNVGAICVDADGVSFENFDLTVKQEPAFLLLNARNISLTGVSIPAATQSFMSVSGAKTKNISIQAPGGQFSPEMIDLGAGIASDAVSY